MLAEQFAQVYATDLSENQLAQAPARLNIVYRAERAEGASFSKNQFDLIVVAQAIHWFDFDIFYKVVDRVLKPKGLFAVLGYTLLKVNDTIDAVIRRLYEDILGDIYWDPERKYIEDHYQTIPFPYDDIEAPTFTQSLTWSYDDLLGYLNTWSAAKHYSRRNHENSVNLIVDDLRDTWGMATTREVHFPILLRAGRKEDNYVT